MSSKAKARAPFWLACSTDKNENLLDRPTGTKGEVVEDKGMRTRRSKELAHCYHIKVFHPGREG